MRACQEGGVEAVRMLSLIVLVGLIAPALAQQAVSPNGTDVDEVIVPGVAPENLRVEIERVETAVYERFNALNSNDEFDIHCFSQAPTGSNIPVRTCAPNFVVQSESRASSKILTDGRGRSGNNYNPAELRARNEEKSRELTEEMQRLAREDEQLLRDLVRLNELKQLQASNQQRAAKR